MVFVGAGDVFDHLAPVAAAELCAAFAGGADVGDGEALVVGHGDDSGFAVAGVAFDADLFGVYRFVGLEVVEARLAPQAQARRAPQSSSLRGCPLLQRPMMPSVRPAPLSAWMLPGTRLRSPSPWPGPAAARLGPAVGVAALARRRRRGKSDEAELHHYGNRASRVVRGG